MSRIHTCEFGVGQDTSLHHTLISILQSEAGILNLLHSVLPRYLELRGTFSLSPHHAHDTSCYCIHLTSLVENPKVYFQKIVTKMYILFAKKKYIEEKK